MNILTRFEKNAQFFCKPETIISCFKASDFLRCLNEIERALDRGYYLAGFFSYEAGSCFEERLLDQRVYDFPLLYMGVYRAPCSPEGFLNASASKDTIEDLRINISREEYFKRIDAIRAHIELGDVYQITYCIKLLFSFTGDHRALFRRLLSDQPVPYPAYIETDRFKVLSLSPEMFIKKTGTRVETKPMKGTWPRRQNFVSDAFARIRFQYDSKNRAENVMIADLLRNDLGRVASQIAVPKLFEVARYRTLYQMTSTITGRLENKFSLNALFGAIFPSGSVTGAPKIRAMQIIRALEGEERRIYTGAIGYITPDRDMFFNVPIRTILAREKHCEMGIGGGIVWDSTAQGEWDEGLLKARFLTDLSARPMQSK